MRREPLSRAAVVATARELVAHDGVAALSLRTLAARLDVTAPALYSHVDDKRDLLRAIAELEFERLVARFESMEEADPLERVRAQFLAYVEQAREAPALFEVMFLFRPDVVPQPDVDELPAATRAFALAMAAVQDAMANTQLRRDDPLKVSLVLWAAAQGASQFLLVDFGFAADYRRELIESLIDTLLAGLRP